MTDLLGYIGLALTASSLTRTKMIHFRLFSFFGGFFFLAQAFLLESNSLILTNVVFMSINATMIYKILRNKTNKDLTSNS